MTYGHNFYGTPFTKERIDAYIVGLIKILCRKIVLSDSDKEELTKRIKVSFAPGRHSVVKEMEILSEFLEELKNRPSQLAQDDEQGVG